jgi:hypothetical protein
MSAKTTTTKNIDAKTTRETTSSDRELIISRIIDAPRERVFKAWTDPELLKQWFAPLPYTTPVAELDVRPGGANLIVMRDPAGNEFPNRASISKSSKTSGSSLPMPTQRHGSRRKSRS